MLGFGADIGLCPLVGPSITWHNQTWNGAGCPNQNQTTSLHPCDQSGEYPCHEQWKYICHGDGDGDAVGRCRLKTKTLSIPAGSVGPIMYAVFITSALNYGLVRVVVSPVFNISPPAGMPGRDYSSCHDSSHTHHHHPPPLGTTHHHPPAMSTTGLKPHRHPA